MNDRITESEWALMEILWQGEMTQPQLAQRLGRKWSKNTVHTFLTRLCAKGVLEVDRERSPHVYRASVSREEGELPAAGVPGQCGADGGQLRPGQPAFRRRGPGAAQDAGGHGRMRSRGREPEAER